MQTDEIILLHVCIHQAVVTQLCTHPKIKLFLHYRLHVLSLCLPIPLFLAISCVLICSILWNTHCSIFFLQLLIFLFLILPTPNHIQLNRKLTASTPHTVPASKCDNIQFKTRYKACVFITGKIHVSAQNWLWITLQMVTDIGNIQTILCLKI